MYKPKKFSFNNGMQISFFTVIFTLIILSLQAKPPLLTDKELASSPPRTIRTCCAFGADLSYGGLPFIKRTDIVSVNEIGNHHYLGGRSESNGIVYTRRGGFIDIGHLRDCADWTAYIYSVIVFSQKNNNKTVIHLGAEGGTKALTFTIPVGTDSLTEYQLARKIAYDISLWHEIATWFGASTVPLVPERFSSFSPEDVFSNLLGATLGVMAIKSELPYDEAMTQILARTLDSLESLKTAAETYAAMEKVENIWWTNKKNLPNKNITLKRYFPSDAYLIPWLVPGFESKIPPYTLARPDVGLSDYYQLKIKLNYKFPSKIVSSFPKNRIITQKDFDFLISYIVKDINRLDERTAYHLQKTKKRVERKQQRTHFSKGKITNQSIN